MVARIIKESKVLKILYKTLKALNSSAKAWQISSSIVLAMFFGFLPFGALMMLTILLFALVININFGLFLLFSAIFGTIGYLFDPAFESIGYAVLTNDSLNSFFTLLYNIPLFRWSEFNYTLVAGSLSVSIILAIPMLLVLNRFITLYRVQIGQKLNEWKFTRWMHLFDENEKGISFFRWWGLGVFAILSSAIAVVVVVIFDPLAKNALEKTLSYTLQTQVDIKDLNTNFSDLRVKISVIEVADKEKLTHNLVQIKDVEFDLGFTALLEKKAMIDKLNVIGVSFDEKRHSVAKSYGKTDVSSDKNNEVTDNSSIDFSKMFEMPNVDDILAKEGIKSLKEAQTLKDDIEKTKNKWMKVSDELKNNNEVEQIKKDAQNLQKSFKGADMTKIASAKSDIDALNSKIKSLKNKYSNLQKEFNEDQKRIQKNILALKDLPQKEYERLKNKYTFDAKGGTNLVSTLISGEIGKYMNMALKYYEKLKPYIDDAKKSEPEDATPPRGEGRWIKYANLSRIPEVVVKESNINVLLKKDKFDIKVKNFSSNQKLYGKAMIASVDAKGEQYKQIVAKVIDDRTTNISKTSFDISAKDFKANSFEAGSVAMSDIVTNASIKGQIKDMIIDANSDIAVKNVKLQMPSQELVNDLLSGISKFNLGISVDGDVNQPKVEVKTDLDKQLSSGISSLASKQIKGFETGLKGKLFSQMGNPADGISSDLPDISKILGSKQKNLSGINTDFSSSFSSDLIPKGFF
jgi:uncharacterized protein (TIGR03545 family)/uncharacterized protein (TIGR03546 family)